MIHSARLEGGQGLPGWLEFDAETLVFQGVPPAGSAEETVLILRATDFDGAWAETRLVLKHAVEA